MPEPSPRHGVAVAEARQRLLEQGWVVTRWIGLRSPPDLFAMGRNAYLLVMVRTSRRQLPDAHAVSIRYHNDLERMRTMRVPSRIRLECWVLAPPDGWKCYEIHPGGIRRCWREGVAPSLEDIPEPEEEEEAPGTGRRVFPHGNQGLTMLQKDCPAGPETSPGQEMRVDDAGSIPSTGNQG